MNKGASCSLSHCSPWHSRMQSVPCVRIPAPKAPGCFVCEQSTSVGLCWPLATGISSVLLGEARADGCSCSAFSCSSSCRPCHQLPRVGWSSALWAFSWNISGLTHPATSNSVCTCWSEQQQMHFRQKDKKSLRRAIACHVQSEFAALCLSMH